MVDSLFGRMHNRVFFPQAALDQWLNDGTVDLRGTELTIVAEARKYRLAEAVRVLQEVSGAEDAQALVGRVKAKSQLEEKGAEILESSMILGDNAYDVIPGWLGTPVGTFDEHVASKERAQARAAGSPTAEDPRSDEDLLAAFLMKSL
jgi:hypothetical protein